MPDRIEAGTFLCLAAITGGKIKLEKVNSNHLTPVIAKLEEAGCEIKIQKEIIEIMINGGKMVPQTVTRAPGIPATRYPTRIDAFTAIAPGEDWAIAVRSIISSSSIQ